MLDTNVLSEFNRRGEPNRLVKQWLEAADTDSLYASVLTFGEIRLGVELLPPGKRRTQLEQWLDRDLPEWFEGRILPVDQSIADRWGLLRAQAQMKGRALSVIDALLAATALQHNLTIVSRNVSDFSIVGLAVVNPWEPPSP
ncbi:MAG: type II toxin-antitoxin system VapC family toxin [Terriglobia bacterium]